MNEEKDFYKSLIDSLYDGVYFVDRERVITYWNKGAERITGYTREQVIGRSCKDNMLNHVSADGLELCKNDCPLTACIKDGTPQEADVFLHHADGHRQPVLVRVSPLRDEAGNIIGAVETFSSDAGSMAMRQELRNLRRTVETDALTGVSSRQYLMRRLRGAVAELDPHAQAGTALLFIDVDSLKPLNDTYGHEVGDRALSMVAATLQHNVRDTDVVGRWGGDEFMVLLYDVTGPDEVQAVAEKLRVLVETSRLDLPDSSLVTTVSIGAVLFQPSDTPESVVRRADELMYRSKRAGKNRVTTG